ncbi:O-antigen ligase family protein, partial [Candidatus Parcubacteria bacterium]|nr:O-antigen ligase family protein [Candidatus Parcubacteria bacterium]
IMIYILFLIWALNGAHSLLFCHFEPVRVRNLRALLCKKNVYIKIVLRSLNRFAHFEMTKKEDALNILNVGIVLLFLGLAISTFNSFDLRTSLGIFKGWFIDPFLFFVVFINIIKKEEHIASTLKSWIASGVVVSLVGIFYLLNNNLTFDGRLKAFFLSPNHLAMYLAPAFLIALVLLLNRLSFLRRQESTATINNRLRVIQNIKEVFSIKYLVLSIFLLIILIPLYCTYSYGAFLGIFVGIIYLLISRIKFTQWRPILNIKYLIFLIIIFTIFISITAIKSDQVINSNERSSFHSRLMIWNASAEIIKDNPLLGIGPGTFQDVYLLYAEKFDEPYLEWAVPQPHNIFLAFYLQTGLIGFVGFILILFWFFDYRRDAINRVSTENILMICILVHGLIDTTYWKNDLALIFWLIIGMMVVSRRIR